MEQVNHHPLSVWQGTKIFVALAMGPVVAIALLVVAIPVVTLGVTLGWPYYFFAKEIHRALSNPVTRTSKSSNIGRQVVAQEVEPGFQTAVSKRHATPSCVRNGIT